MQKFLDKWLTPATAGGIIMTVVGLIIWGIQLNIAIIAHTERLESFEVQAKKIRAEYKLMLEAHENLHSHRGMFGDVNKIYSELASQNREISELRKIITDHNKEAEQWKRRIIKNELSK